MILARRILSAIAVLALLAPGISQAQETCVDSLLPSESSPIEPRIDYIRKNFQSGSKSCAVAATRAAMQKFVATPGRDAINARYSLRETALSLLEDKSSTPAQRLEMLTAATASSSVASPTDNPLDLRVDVKMLKSASEIFSIKTEGDAAVQAEIQAVVLARRLGDEHSFNFWVPAYSNYRQKLKWLKAIENDDQLKSEPPLMEMGLVSPKPVIYSESADKAKNQEQADSLLALAEALIAKDTPEKAADWSPPLLLWTGLAYFRLGENDKAKTLITRALSAIRSIKLREHRLQRLSLALDSLMHDAGSQQVSGQTLQVHYDVDTIMTLIDEILAPINTSDTDPWPSVRELRQRAKLEKARLLAEPQCKEVDLLCEKKCGRYCWRRLL